MSDNNLLHCDDCLNTVAFISTKCYNCTADVCHYHQCSVCCIFNPNDMTATEKLYCIKCAAKLPHFLNSIPSVTLDQILNYCELDDLVDLRKQDKYLHKFVKPSKHFRPTYLEIENQFDALLYFSDLPQMKRMFTNVHTIDLTSTNIDVRGLPGPFGFNCNIKLKKLILHDSIVYPTLHLFTSFNELIINFNQENITDFHFYDRMAKVLSSLRYKMRLINKGKIKPCITLTITKSLNCNNNKIEPIAYSKLVDALDDVTIPNIATLIVPNIIKPSIQYKENLHLYFPDLLRIEYYNNDVVTRSDTKSKWYGTVEELDIKVSRKRKTIELIDGSRFREIGAECSACSDHSQQAFTIQGYTYCYNCAIEQKMVIEQKPDNDNNNNNNTNNDSSIKSSKDEIEEVYEQEDENIESETKRARLCDCGSDSDCS